MLHITNVDIAVGAIGATGAPGEIIPWRDVLHEGPVPAGLAPAELREVRARFISLADGVALGRGVAALALGRRVKGRS